MRDESERKAANGSSLTHTNPAMKKLVGCGFLLAFLRPAVKRSLAIRIAGYRVEAT